MTSNERKLREFAEQFSVRNVTEVVPGVVYHVTGFGHSNATFIIAEHSVILIDTLDSDARGKLLLGLIRERTDKPIRTIIYTHGHPDHRGGAGSLIEHDPEIISFAAARPLLGRTHLLTDVLNARGARQFGYTLTDEQIISQGLGPREGTVYEENYSFVPPTTVYSEHQVNRNIDGVELEMVAAPGETDDTIFVWLPEYRVLCCADNYYACWPNLSAIRGHQYRDIDAWVASLQKLIDKEAASLLPGHFAPIIGAEEVRTRLSNYREAIEYVLEQTLQLLNQGFTPREVVSRIQLPPHLANLKELRQFYGTVEWSVYGIFSGYIGWFDGNPTNLHPLENGERALKLVNAMGGVSIVQSHALEAVANAEYQWALELTDLLIALNPDNHVAKAARIDALYGASDNELNATARNYYISSALELNGSE